VCGFVGLLLLAQVIVMACVLLVAIVDRCGWILRLLAVELGSLTDCAMFQLALTCVDAPGDLRARLISRLTSE